MRTVEVIILARDEMVGSFLREQIGALRGVKVVRGDIDDAHNLVVDAHLLTPAEQRVLQACQHHDRLTDVAHALCLTRDTVKKHLTHIYLKLKVNSLHRALLRAKELGLLEEKRQGKQILETPEHSPIGGI